MKHVVNITELHKLIPETRVLEGVNFKDMKSLISSVIEKVEESGNWEYVQYISGNPSLFVVKEKEMLKYQTPSNEPSYLNQTIYTDENLFNKSSKVKKEKKTEKVKEDDHQELYTSNDADLFPETKMPW
jgi:hypothetical protein